jgi:sugar transport system ATP-binding protein
MSLAETTPATPARTRDPSAGRSVVKSLEATALTKSYPGVTALKGVDFAVSAGEVRALLGKNGAGKSTLVKIFSGREAPDTGMLKVAGRRIDAFTPGTANALGVATVHQELSLVSELSVAENIFLGR